jgi:AraC family carnitine catabolism transcriptional activator
LHTVFFLIPDLGRRGGNRHGRVTFAIAAAGLTGDRDAVVHWEALASYLEHFPEANIKNQIYRIDKQLAFCAGGVATLDMMLDIISTLRGAVLAKEVANALIHTPRISIHPQRTDDDAESARPSLPRRIISLMEGNLDFPLSPKTIARDLGVSVRTLERMSPSFQSDTKPAISADAAASV